MLAEVWVTRTRGARLAQNAATGRIWSLILPHLSLIIEIHQHGHHLTTPCRHQQYQHPYHACTLHINIGAMYAMYICKNICQRTCSQLKPENPELRISYNLGAKLFRVAGDSFVVYVFIYTKRKLVVPPYTSSSC